MSVAPAATALCDRCAAVLPVEQGAVTAVCAFCGATNAVDKTRTVFHYAVRPTLRDDAALGALRRWMAGNTTVKNLDRRATISRPVFRLFPFWLVRVDREGQEKVLLEPAAALSISELRDLHIPAADLEPYDGSLDADGETPTVPQTAVFNWLRQDHDVPAAAVREMALVHVPFYQFKYTFQSEVFTAIVDAASGQVFASIFPAKLELPYRTIGAAAFVLYLLAAFVPLGGYLIGGFEGLVAGLVFYALALVFITVPVFVGAIIVAARI